MKLHEMRQYSQYTLLFMTLPPDTHIIPAKAVIGNSEMRELINIGSSIEFASSPNEVHT